VHDQIALPDCTTKKQEGAMDDIDKFVALGLARHVKGGYEITESGLDAAEAHYTH
jgi:hypothetical protein